MAKTYAVRVLELQNASQLIALVLLDLYMSEESNPRALLALKDINDSLYEYLQTYQNALAEGALEEEEG